MTTRSSEPLDDHLVTDPAVSRSAKRQRNDEDEVEDHPVKRGKSNETLYFGSSDKDEDIFPAKLMKILDDEKNAVAIRWSRDGAVFGIQQTEFEAQIMSKHFQSSRFASFVRRLSRWGFERAVREEFPLDWIVYRHHLFRRGNAALLKNLTSGQMYEINAFKEETIDSTPQGSALNPTLLTSNLTALGSERRVASLPRDHVSRAQSIAGELWQAKMGKVLAAGNNAANVEILRTQGRHPAALLPTNSETSNMLFATRSNQNSSMLSVPSISQDLVDEAILNNLSNDQLAQMSIQIENRRLLVLLRSHASRDTSSVTDALFPARSLTNPLLQSNLLAAFDLLQQGRQSAAVGPFSHLSDEEIIRYLLFSQHRR